MLTKEQLKKLPAKVQHEVVLNQQQKGGVKFTALPNRPSQFLRLDPNITFSFNALLELLGTTAPNVRRLFLKHLKTPVHSPDHDALCEMWYWVQKAMNQPNVPLLNFYEVVALSYLIDCQIRARNARRLYNMPPEQLTEMVLAHLTTEQVSTVLVARSELISALLATNGKYNPEDCYLLTYLKDENKGLIYGQA